MRLLLRLDEVPGLDVRGLEIYDCSPENLSAPLGVCLGEDADGALWASASVAGVGGWVANSTPEAVSDRDRAAIAGGLSWGARDECAVSLADPATRDRVVRYRPELVHLRDEPSALVAALREQK